MKMGSVIRVIASLFMLSASVSAGPATQALHIWYDASDVDGDGDAADNPAHGSAVATWYDKATGDGSQNTSPQGASPLLATNGLNGMSVVSFSGTNDSLSFTLNTPGPRSFFLVGKGVNGVQFWRSTGFAGSYGLLDRTGKLLAGYSDGGVNTSLGTFNVDLFYLLTTVHATDGTRVFTSGELGGQTAETFMALTTPAGSHLLGNYLSGGNVGGDADPLIAELLVYTGAVSYVEQTLTENYLSAKYGFALPAAKEWYVGDDPANGDFDFDVFGIGRESNMTVSAASAGGLRVEESGGSLDNGDSVMAGHAGTASGYHVGGTLPADVTIRWARVWYVDKRGAVDATLTFDYGDAGLSFPAGSPTHTLLYSSTGDPYAFTALSASPSVSGDEVSFTVSNAELADGFYTLGSDVAVPEPTGVADTGGLPARALHIWYDATDVDGDGDAADNPTNGAAVATWYDKAAADGSQNTSPQGASPLLATNGLNGMSVVTFSGTNDSLSFGLSNPGERSFFLVAKGISCVQFWRSTGFAGSYGLLDRTGKLLAGYSDGGVNTSLGTFNADLFYLLTTVHATDGTRVFTSGELGGQTAETFMALTTPAGSHLLGNYLGGGNVAGDADPFIGELLVYTGAVSYVEQTLTENYLSAKYGFALSVAKDGYAGDDPANGDYDLGVCGIGRVDADDEIASVARDGLGLSSVWGLLDGQWVLAGHKAATNGLVSPIEGVQRASCRWLRTWYIDATGTIGDIDLSFDAGDGNVAYRGGSPVLLYSATDEPSAWTSLEVTSTRSGDRVIFRLPYGALVDGYYTVGFYPSGSTLLIR